MDINISSRSEKESLEPAILEKIQALGYKLAADKGRKIKIMEVCGTHTVAYARSGITDIIRDCIELRSGPGCPICVTHQEDLDRIFFLSGLPNTLITTFGDMLRVPGTHTTLEKEKAKGSRIEICYSPLEALELAKTNPSSQVVFIAIGFETTTPAIAATLMQAEASNLRNFWLYPLLKLVPPAITALLKDSDSLALDGFILPGHVSAILGASSFSFITKSKLPAVVAGFERFDLLAGVYNLLLLIKQNKFELVNAYSHVVKMGGNIAALNLINHCFEVEPTALWRGLGSVPLSSYTLKAKFARFNAALHFNIEVPPAKINPLCICGDVITGKATPHDCMLFGERCNPSSPIGPCMVSPEGVCGAYYNYLS